MGQMGQMDGAGWGGDRKMERGKGVTPCTYILNVGFRNQAFVRHIQVLGQQHANGFHQRDGLVFGEITLLQVLHQGEGVEVVDVARGLEVRRFMLLGRGGGGFFAAEHGGERMGEGAASGDIVANGFLRMGFAGVEIAGGFVAYGGLCGGGSVFRAVGGSLGRGIFRCWWCLVGFPFFGLLGWWGLDLLFDCAS